MDRNSCKARMRNSAIQGLVKSLVSEETQTAMYREFPSGEFVPFFFFGQPRVIFNKDFYNIYFK